MLSKSAATNYRNQLATGTVSHYMGKDLPRRVRELTQDEKDYRIKKLQEYEDWVNKNGKRRAYKTQLAQKLSKILGNTEDIKADTTAIKADTTAIKKDTEDLKADIVAIKTKLEEAKNDIIAAIRTEDKKKKDAKEEKKDKKDKKDEKDKKLKQEKKDKKERKEFRCTRCND